MRPNPAAPIELYDLATDAAESKNLASEKPDLVAKAAGFTQCRHRDRHVRGVGLQPRRQGGAADSRSPFSGHSPWRGYKP